MIVVDEMNGKAGKGTWTMCRKMIFVVVSLIAAPTFAQSDVTRERLSELGYGYSQCAAFYQFASKCVGDSDHEMATRLDGSGDKARAITTALLRKAGMSYNAILATGVLNAQLMMKDVDRS